jgi:phage tail-like protein
LTTGIEPVDLELSADGSIELPGKRTPPTVVLKRGKNNSMELQQWLEMALQGDPAARKSCSLVMYNTSSDPVARYYLEQAWPSKIEIGGRKAGAQEEIVETVTFVASTIRASTIREGR